MSHRPLFFMVLGPPEHCLFFIYCSVTHRPLPVFYEFFPLTKDIKSTISCIFFFLHPLAIFFCIPSFRFSSYLSPPPSFLCLSIHFITTPPFPSPRTSQSQLLFFCVNMNVNHQLSSSPPNTRHPFPLPRSLTSPFLLSLSRLTNAIIAVT